MSESKAKNGKVASSKKGEAARAEADTSKPRTVDFRGLAIDLPAKPPLSLSLRWRKISKEVGGDDGAATLALFELVIGEDQWEAIAQKCDEEGLTLEDTDVLGDLMEEISDVLGIGPGE